MVQERNLDVADRSRNVLAKLTVERAAILALAVLSEAVLATRQAPVKGTLALRACLAFVTAKAGGNNRVRGTAIQFWRVVTGRIGPGTSFEPHRASWRYSQASSYLDNLIRECGYEPDQGFHLRLEAHYRDDVRWTDKVQDSTMMPNPEFVAWEADLARIKREKVEDEG